MIHSSTARPAPVWLDRKDGRKVEEPSDLADFVKVLLTTYQAAAATNLDAFTTFKPDPRESLPMLGMRFNLIALPLEGANLMTLRMLALSLMEHLPNMIRDNPITKMVRQDQETGAVTPMLRSSLLSLALMYTN